MRLSTYLALPIALALITVLYADDSPQWLGPQRDGVWRESGILDKFPPDGPKLRWKYPVNEGYAGPAVGSGVVVVTDWKRSPDSAKAKSPFDRGKQLGDEGVICLDEKTGQKLWSDTYPAPYSVSYAAGPRCTPIIADGRVYTLGAMGDLLCYDLKKGERKWHVNFVRDFEAPVPLWGWSAHPLLDGDQLICLVGGKKDESDKVTSVVMSFHKDTGKVLWQSQSASEIGYAPPMIYTAGKSRQLIIWHPDAVLGLDPANGNELWRQDFKVKAGLSVPTPRLLSGNRMFVSSFYNGSMMLQLSDSPPNAKVLWQGKSNSEMPKRTDGLHSIMPTPFIVDDYIYGICSYGQLRCLKADTGERVWEDLQATGGKLERWGNAFLTQQGERFFLFNEHGDLIIAKLTPKGYDEIDRTKLLEPTNGLVNRPVVWSQPAFANRSIYVRNDRELKCFSLAAE